jgi:signal peptidase I
VKEHLREIIRAAGLLVTGIIVVVAIRQGSRFSCVNVPDEFTMMDPTLRAGQSLVIRRGAQSLVSVPIGSIVVFYVVDAGEKVGRVVAHPGQVVSVKNGQYYVNGELASTKATASGLGRMQGIVVPRDCVFVGFDNAGGITFTESIVPLRNIIGTTKEK